MNKVSFIIKRVANMNVGAMFKTVGRMHKKCKKSRVGLLFDVIRCGAKYGAGYLDYEYFEFYDLDAEQRASYIVRTTNNLIIAHCNKREHYHWLHDKIDFNTRYNDFLHRGWIDFRTATKEEFLEFVKDKKALMVKIVDASCGIGIEKINVADYADGEAVYEKLKTMPNAQLIEEYVVQHKKMSELYPHSVNTCRITTLLVGDEVHIINSSIRIGNNNSVVDNISSGGMSTVVDTASGTILFPASDEDGKKYESHPMTGTPIKGFTVPHWDAVIDMCKRAAKITPELRFCGWDVAITDETPLLIEGNQLPGYFLFQLPPSMQSGRAQGMKPRFKELLKDEFEVK